MLKYFEDTIFDRYNYFSSQSR